MKGWHPYGLLMLQTKAAPQHQTLHYKTCEICPVSNVQISANIRLCFVSDSPEPMQECLWNDDRQGWAKAIAS